MDNIETSATTDKIFKVIFNIQQEVEDIKKDTDNEFFKSKYAALDSILPILKPLFVKHGIMYTHIPYGKNRLMFMLWHEESKEFIRTHVDMGEIGKVVDKNGVVTENPQKVGSAITYYRRYTLVSLLGLNIVGEDDDGNKASGNKKADKTAPGYDEELGF